MTEPLVREVADRILVYLDEHPRASDTVDGIHHWWLGDPSPGVTLDITRCALETLEAAGRVQRHVFLRCTVWRLRIARPDADGDTAP